VQQRCATRILNKKRKTESKKLKTYLKSRKMITWDEDDNDFAALLKARTTCKPKKKKEA
jgi:hypothetical protein